MFGLFKRKNSIQEIDVTENWPFDSDGGFVVLDFETTGLSPLKDRVIEIGMIKTDTSGRPVAFWQTFVHPEGPVGATHIHGITEKDVKNSPKFSEVSGEVIKRLRGQSIVGHNVSFDHSFLEAELARSGWSLPSGVPTICTCLAARQILPGLGRYRLVDCASALGLDNQGGHRALKDAGTTAGLLHAFLNSSTDTTVVKSMKESLNIAKTISWPSEPGIPPKPESHVSQRLLSPSQQTERPSEPPAIVEALKDLAPDDFLPDSATEAEISWAELLLTVLEDGQITSEEIAALDDLATTLGLSEESINEAKTKLLVCIAREAWRDGKVSRIEKSDIQFVANLLQLSDKEAKKSLAEVELARIERLNRKTKPLPTDRQLGTPLQIGDRVVFTGCYESNRSGMEVDAVRAGLKVTGSVSKKTSLLVTDQTINGVKDSAAIELGIRRVSPAEFTQLLEFIQPASAKKKTPRSKGQKLTVSES